MANEGQKLAPTSGTGLLPKWANGQDGWTRAIVADVLARTVAASNADIDLYLKILLSEKQLSGHPYDLAPQIEEKQLDAAPMESVQLDSLQIGTGVNALKPGSKIDFASGITIIFGENGSGKSGFVRVLKRAAGVRTAEEILHNVRTEQRVTPSGTFGVTVGDAKQTLSWANDFGIAPLNRVNIFDSRGARLHVEDDLTYVYTPGELTLFPLIQNGIERVRAALDAAIAVRTPGPNLLLASFDRTCSIYPSIETLGAATEIEKIQVYAKVPDDIDVKIESLKVEIEALGSTQIQNELKRARDRQAIVKSLSGVVDTVDTFDADEYRARVATWNEATLKRDAAGSKAFEGDGIPGVLTNEWRQFVEAGEAYLKKHQPSEYPQSDDACIYCQQSLTGKAVELIQKYRDFTNSEITTALAISDSQLRDYISKFATLKIEEIHERLLRETNGESDVLHPLIEYLDKIRDQQLLIAARSPLEWPDKASTTTAARDVLSKQNARINETANSLQSSVEERQAALRTKQNELIELQGRKTAHKVLPQIEKRVADARWASRAGIVKNNLTGVLKGLTETAKASSEELLNNDFSKRFEGECKKLRAPNVTLNFPGRQGQVTRRKLVASYKPSEVLSEGEQKALALADFLAEVTAVPASSPVVFDDPITSMDYRRIHEVCDRVVELAGDHQVVVFTHNIWFAAELLSKAEKKSWKYYDIRLEGGEAGVVSAAAHPRVDTIAQVSNRVKTLIDAAEKVEGEVRAALVEKGYEELRGLCEVAVEHELLKGVVQRYTPNVMMTKLDKIRFESLKEGIEAIVPIFEKACRYIASHSQPLETQGIRPTLEELKSDFVAVLTARQPHKE